MRLGDLKTYEFVEKWKGILSRPSDDEGARAMLWDYRPICGGLLYEDASLVEAVVEILKANVRDWARRKTSVYSGGGVVSKEDLAGGSWWVGDISSESMPMATSGTTTGTPFRYLRWEPFLYFIEAENHYDLIMDEFGVRQNPSILNLFNSDMYDRERLVTVRGDSKNFMDHHGLSRRASVHYANFSMMESDRASYFDGLLSHMSENRIDVLFAPGSAINSLCDAMKRLDLKRRICGLVSNSNERMLPEDKEFLLDGRCDHVCDHMRSWDGGATFFTCRLGTYHLMDNLSWCEDVEGRLVSTDYFNLASPFVRYWNGDYCRIEDSWRRCGCGRLYRPFSFLESRPFSLKGFCIRDLKTRIGELSLGCVKQVRCGINTIDVVSSEDIPEDKRRAIEAVTDRFKFRFLVEPARPPKGPE